MRTLVFLILTTLATAMFGDEQKQLALLDRINQESALLERAVAAGDQRALLCKYCHGADGNSKKSTIPNLAGQNSMYLIRQFELFDSGKRQNRTMNELAKVLNDQDKVNIALFYAIQTVQPQTIYRPDLRDRGEHLFNTRCFFCHGRDGHGKEHMPRIASQPADYLIRTLSSYKSSLVKRAETQMSAIARTLEKDDIEALAAYLTTLR